MNRIRATLLAISCLTISAAWSDDPASIDEQVESIVQKDQRPLAYWATQLSSDRYFRRQTATRRLLEGGRDSIPVLMNAINTGDLESVRSAISVLASLASREHPNEDDGAYAALQKVAERGIGAKSTLAKAGMADLSRDREAEARSKLVSLGLFIGTKEIALGSRRQQRNVVQIDESFRGDVSDLAWLRWLHGVDFAAIEGESVTREALDSIGTLPDLETVLIIDAEMEPAEIQSLGQIKRLNELEFRYVHLTETLLTELKKIRVRNSLYLVGTKVSEEDVQAINAVSPGLSITHRRGGFLGVVCPSTAEAFCRVDQVAPGSGADKAGLKRGDFIIGIDDAKVSRFEDLQKQIDTHDPGDEIQIRYLRDNEELSGTAILGKLIDQ